MKHSSLIRIASVLFLAFIPFMGIQSQNLYLGSEVEISNNFVYNERGEHNRFYAIPTIAAKRIFKKHKSKCDKYDRRKKRDYL